MKQDPQSFPDMESPASFGPGEAGSADATAGTSESDVPLSVVVSFRTEDYHAASNLWSFSNDRVGPSPGPKEVSPDAFWQFGDDWWIERPPAGHLKLVLEALSPGLGGSTMQRLDVLADELVACEDEEEPMVDVCQEMSHLLQQVMRALMPVADSASPEWAEALTLSCTWLKIGWAFTWVETLLLEDAMLQDWNSEGMQSVRDRWERVHLSWPESLKRTKRTLDFNHRLALLYCGQEAEAVENFKATDYWEGFELCFLRYVSSARCNPSLRKPGRIPYVCDEWNQIGSRCLHWIRRAGNAGPQHHEHWSLVRLRTLMVHCQSLRLFGRHDLHAQVLSTALEEVQQIDLQLRFDFPVPHPQIQFLKWELLRFWKRHRSAGWQPNELVPRIGPEVLERSDVVHSFRQARYACCCLILRGEQLIEQGLVDEGLEVLRTCIAKLRSNFNMPWLEIDMLSDCEAMVLRDWNEMGDLDRVDKLQAFLVAHGKQLQATFLANSFARRGLSVCGFSGPATFLPSVVPALKPSNAALEAFWESYKDCCAALSLESATRRRCVVKHHSSGVRKYIFQDSWVPYTFLFLVHAMAATISNVIEGANIEIARQALLALESARNYKWKDFGHHMNWDWIERAHRACGPGAVFVQFVHTTTIAYGGPWTVCIVVQDEGVASFHNLCGIDPDNIQENVREIADACIERTLERDSCRNALETLYDLLMRPLFCNFIRDKDWTSTSHRKLVVSAVGCFQDVPFNILRNRESGCYLLQEVKLAFTPSFLMLALCQSWYESYQESTLVAGAGAAVALGDPKYLPYEDPLPGSRREVDAICELFEFCRPAHEIVKLLDKDATVERLLEWVKKPWAAGSDSDCSQAFIHIAAHGSGGEVTDHGTLRLAPPATRTRRRLRAAQGRATLRDGQGFEPATSSDELEDLGMEQDAFDWASAAEPEGLDFLPRLLRSGKADDAASLLCDNLLLSQDRWRAFLVVLSGCHTGAGVALHLNSFDVLSFSRALMSVWVPCCVLAQWKVDDSSTAHLMPLFYEALCQGEDACSALQSAMIKMHQAGKYTIHQLAPFVVAGLPTVCLPAQMRRRPAQELASIPNPQA